MGFKPYTLLLGILFTFTSIANLQAQNNLVVEYNGASGLPNFLNICGEPDTARVTVRITGLEIEARENIVATLNLFEGAQFVEMLTAESDAGVSLLNAGLNTATFSIPDLGITESITEVDFSFLIKADCNFIDTINANNEASVLDLWNLSYDLDGSSLTESEFTAEYKDAFAVPNLTISNTNNVTVSSIGECFDRDIILSNSGLSGFIDSLDYEATYGPGITITNLQINGVDYPLVKTAVGVDTLYQATISGEFLELNSLGAGIGDGDQSLDPDESLFITETVCVLSCDVDRSSIHNVSWGCYGSGCESEMITNFVTIGSGEPNPVAVNSGTVANQPTGYCQDGSQTITFTNSGNEVDAGYGTMRDLELGIGLGNDFLMDVDKFEIFSITIAGITITTNNPLVRLDEFIEFQTDPLNGLIDFDEDGYYDDLPINESIEITVGYRFVCSEASSLDESCENSAAVSLGSKVFYSNACAERLVLEDNSVIRPSNITPDSESSTDTDAIIGMGAFHVQYNQLRTVSNFAKACLGEEKMIVTVDLPTGISVDLAETNLFRGTSIPLPLLTSNTNGTITELIYDASISTFISGDFTIDLGLVSDCNAIPGATSFPVTLAHYCPDCDCTHTWFCGDLDGPILHPNTDLCLNAPPCPNGIRALGFDVERTTLGYTDETYTTQVDPADANLKVAISCDSVLMTITSTVGDDIISDDVGVIISYDNPEGIEGLEEIFLFDGADVEIRQLDGTVSNCTVAASAITVTAVDLNKTLDIELDDCLASLGLTLSPSDTIIFKGMFSLNPDGPYNEQFKLVPNFRGEMYHTFGGDQLSCDNFGEAFTIAKTGSLFTFPSTPSFPQGCSETSLEYEVAVFNNDFGLFYTNEFIPAAFADSIKFTFDPAILDAFEDLSIEVSIPNHPIHGNDFYEIDGLAAFPSGNYVATFDTLDYIPSYNTSFSAAFTLRLNLVANCGSETASSDGNNLFTFVPTIFYRDRIYAETIGDGSCASYVEESVNNNILYTESPSFSLQSLSNPNPQVMRDTVQWVLQHCNTSTESDAGLNWFALDIPNTSVNITQIQDISTGVPVDVPFTAYGSNNSVFAYVDPLLRNFSGNSSADICNTYIVTADFNNCGTFALVARSGWNCTAFDEVDWTPELYAPCNEDTVNLTVTTLEGALDAQVELDYENAVDFCDTLTYEILVRNTELGNIFNMKNDYFLPLIGLDFVPNSFELAYPSEGDFVPISNPPSLGVTSRGETYGYNDFSFSPFLEMEGLQGFNPIMPTVDSNEYVVRFKVIPNCNFVSGEQIRYSFQGVSSCGDSTNTEFGETLPIFIQGIPEPTQLFLTEFGSATTYDPSGNGTLEVVISNILGGPSDDNDVVRVVLPIGTMYTPNSVVPITPATWTPGEPEIIVEDGFNILYWDMPEGVVQGESINFTFGFTGTPIPLCATDTLNFNLFTLDRYEIPCGDTEVCDIFAGTTEGGEQSLDLIVTNGTTLELTNATSNCIDDTTEEVTVNGSINNLPLLSADANVSFYYDSNMNGVGEQGTDVLLSNYVLPSGSSGTVNFSETFNVTNVQLCNLLMSFDTTGTGVCNLPNPVVINPELQNAGVFANYCGNEITIGSDQCSGITSYTYSWTALAPATNADISDANILNPVLTVDATIPVGTTLSYVLETTREGCGFASTDTIEITVQPDLTVNIDSNGSTQVCEGESITLTTMASETVSHAWSDGTNNLGTEATLVVAPTANTTYTVIVTNTGGCTASSAIDITTATGITTIDAGNDETICLGSSVQLQGVATGTGTLSYVWSGANLSDSNIANPEATPTVTTTYSLTVTDEDGCTATDDVIITVDPDAPMADVQTNNICVGLTTVITASGGNAYTWTEMTGNPSGNTLSALNIANPTFAPEAAGTYNFEVLVEGGCADVTVPVSVEVTSIQVTTAQTDLDQCAGDVQAVSITLEENIQSYTINGGASQNDASNGAVLTFDAIFNGATSNYVIELTGVSGCTATTTFDFVECPCIPTIITGTVTTDSKCGETSGSATINITGNPSDYTFTWNPNVGIPSADGATRTDLEAGFYQITISENANPTCITETALVIGNSDGPQPTSIITTPANCSSADGTATILPTDWTYAWSDGGNGDSRNDLLSGLYGVTVTNPSDPDCINVIPVVIQEDNDLEASHTVITDPTCGNNDGSVEITVTGGNNFSYIWSDGGTGAIRNNLSAGTYLVNIMEIGGDECTISYIFALTDSDVPAAPVTINEVMDVLCIGEANGSVDFTVALPVGIENPVDTIITDGFTEWTNGSLAAGQYCIEIRDVNDCVNGAVCFEIESPEPITASIATTTACGDGGSVDITVAGGTGIYTFDWADIPGTNNPRNRANLAAGNYQLTITDTNGCSIELNGGITIETCACTIEPEIENVIIQEAHCGEADGEVIITVSPSSANLDYTWSPDLGTAVGDGNIRTDLPAGGYTVTVSDASGVCFDVATFAVTNQDGPEVDMPITTSPANCGAADGSATLLPATLNYAWSDGGTGNSRNDLAAGTYFVSVSNPGNPTCFSVFLVGINLNNTLEVTVTTTQDPTCGNTDGSVLANTIGGSGTYDYAWSFGGTTDAAQDNLQSGIYAVTATDANAAECEASTTFLLEDSDVAGADIVINSITDVSCGGENNGMIDYEITPQAGFQGPETIVISDGNSVFENGMLPGGNYCIAIYDANGCVAGGDCFTIGESEELDVIFSISEGCGDEGSINIIVSGGTTPYTFDWADLPGTDNPEDRDDLSTGLYAVTITDSDGCSATGVDLTVVCEECDIDLDLESVTIVEATCGNSDGAATVNTSADLSLLTFTWTPDEGTEGATGNIRTDLPAGGYIVLATDASGFCMDSISFVVNNSDGPELDEDPITTAADCGTANGTATLLPDTYDYSWSDGGTGATRNDLLPGTYFVTFTDPSDPDCEGIEEIKIDQNNTLEVDVNIDVQPTCGNADGTVTANVINGSGNYVYDWSFGGTNMTETGVPAGTHSVTVTDLDSPECTATETFILTDSDVVTIYDVTINAVTNVTCEGAADGSVDFEVDPSTGFTAVISDGTNVFTNNNLPGGNYCINIIDAMGCVAGGECFTIEESDALEGEFSISGGCEGDGAINLNVTGGTGNYTYTWSDIGVTPTADRTDLPIGMYTVTISDENGCSLVGNGLIIECTDCNLDLQSVTIMEATCGNDDGAATINTDANVGTLIFEWTPNIGTSGITGNIRTNLPAGGYMVLAMDVSGSCVDSISFAITNENGPELDGTPETTAADCGTANGTATLLPNTYDYEWSDGGTGATRTDLFAGIYFVTFTNPSNPDCEGVEEIIIDQNNTLEVDVNIDVQPTCGNADGTVTANVINGGGNYAYQWSFGGTNMTETGVPAGIHSIIVTDLDSPECTATETFILTDSDVVTIYDVTINAVTHVSCAGEAGGSVDFEVNPPTGFTAVISDGTNVFSDDNLPGGDYCISIIDVMGCVAGGDCFTIEESEPLEGEFSISGGCDNDGDINLNVTGGTGDYTYSWSDLTGANQPGDRTGLTEGAYTVTVTDENGCTLVGNSLVVECGGCNLDLDLQSVTITEASCGNDNGAATVNTTVDLGALVFTWSPNVGTIGGTGNIRTDLPAGGYLVTAMDTTGLCMDSISFVITNSDGPELDAEPVTTAADCSVANGTVTLSPSTYDYEWSDAGMGATRNDLLAGTYFVTFTDPSNPDCESIEEIIIDQNNTLEVEVTIDTQPTCGNADGAVTATVTNGNGNYSYEWSFGGTNMTETGVPAGTHSVLVTDLDSPNCTATETFILTDSNVTTTFDVTINDITNVTCAGAADGFVDFAVDPMTGFTTVISDGTTVFSNGSLPGGDYCVNVVDANGCIAGGECFTIEESAPLEGEFSLSGGCESADGAISLNITGGTGDYTYTWNDIGAIPDADRTDLEAGTYTVTITDENGCTLVGDNLTIECNECELEPNVLSTTIFEATCGNADGGVIINLDVNPGQVVYTWDPNIGTPGVTGNIRTDLPAGGYTVTIADSTGLCSDIVTFAITNEDGPEIDDPILTPADCSAENGTAILTPSNYTYTWSDGEQGDTRNDLATGVYFVTFTDPANPDCEGVEEINIGQNDILDIEITIVTAPTCGNTDGEVSATVSNGSGNYSYAWSSGGIGITESGLSSGTYMVTVTDTDSPECTATETFILLDSDATAIDITIDSLDNISCAGENDGNVNYTATIPTGFTLTITDGMNTYENGSLPAGDYCIEIRDAMDCLAGGDCFTIEPATELDVEFSISGGCGSDGAIDISVNGGTGNYNIDWLDIPGENNDEDRTNLETGVYNVVISDENECTIVGFELPVMCDECEAEIIDYTIAFESVCGGAIGSAEVVITGNPTDYQFDWTPAGVGNESVDGTKLTEIPAGVYQVVVTDTANVVCSDSISILVTNEDAPEATVDLITPSECGGATGSVSISPDSLTYEWSDGGTGEVRDDLAAGIYEVIYYDDEDTICYNVLLIEIQDTASFDLTVDVVEKPDCNTNNGTVTVNVNGGTGPFNFFWSNGESGETLADLPSGTYSVIVTDEATGCTNEIVFTLDDDVAATATVNITEITDISCNGEGLGAVIFDVAYDPTFSQPALVTVTDGFTQYDSNNLPQGSYCINIMDSEGCQVTSECFEIGESEDLEISVIGTYAGCEGTGELGAFDVTVSGGTAPYTFDWADLNDPIEPEDRTDLEAGIYSLTVTDALGCEGIAENIGLDTFCIVDCDYFEMDTLSITTMDCGDSLQVCSNLTYSDFLIGNYGVTINGDNYDVVVEDVCEAESQFTYNTLFLPGNGEIGPYFVDSWVVNGEVYSGEFNTVPDLVDSMNVWDVDGNWELNGLLIVGGLETNSYGQLTVHVVSNPALSNTLNADIINTGTSVGFTVAGPGENEIIITNNETLCSDTMIVNIVCMDYQLEDTILLGDSIFYCLDVAEIILNTDLEGNIVSLENACPDSSGTSVTFNIESEVPPCISYLGLTPGTDTACLVICDDLGICDTVNYLVTVVPSGPLTVTDTIIVTQVDTFCLDTLTNLCGDIVSVTNFCDDGSPEVIFEIIEDTWCVTYEGVELGIDSACLEVTDEYGNMDTVIIVITVQEITSDTICDTIFIGQVVQYCLDTTEVLGAVATMENECQDESGDFVEFFLEEGTWCVTYEGVEDVGTDSACIVLCDDLGICDTTYFCITVVEYFDPPIAVDDYDTTLVNVPIVINVKGNDTVLGGIDSIYIIDEPQVGSVEINMDCTITYDPDEGVCSVEDQFTYVVCNPNACDTATVFIYIECTDLTIFNGFSPNADGVNDVFYIDGIEDFPNNKLCIYNRWGNKVYEKEGYNNEWSGTWSGNDLPDGTYFYVLDLGDEEHTTYHGYIQIVR